MKLRVVIIDDEQPARDLVKVFLKDMQQLQLVGEAENGFDGAKLINELKPDLVLLDIQMPKIDGFEMLEILDYHPQVIFCTAFDDYAIKAFEKNAIDYLLKPFSKNRYIEAIEKVIRALNGGEAVSPPQASDYQKPLDRVVIKDRKEIIILNVNQIVYLEAQDDYVEIHIDKGKWLKQKTMKYFEEALDEKEFCRVHRKYIIRLAALSKIDKMGKESYLAVLKSGENIPVSTNGYQKLKVLLGI